jgi:DNA-binding Lrp family transcriptional regulator
MLNYVNVRDLFYKATDSYDVLNRLKKYEKNGIRFVYVNNRNRINLRYMMYILVGKSKEGYSLEDIYHIVINLEYGGKI